MNSDAIRGSLSTRSERPQNPKRNHARQQREKIRSAWTEQDHKSQPAPQDIWDELDREANTFTIRAIGKKCIRNGTILRECLEW